MNFVIFVVVSVLVMSVVNSVGKKYTKPIIRINSKKKYEIIMFFTIIILGMLVAGSIDFEEEPVISGACFGILESIVKIFVGYESENE